MKYSLGESVAFVAAQPTLFGNRRYLVRVSGDGDEPFSARVEVWRLGGREYREMKEGRAHGMKGMVMSIDGPGIVQQEIFARQPDEHMFVDSEKLGTREEKTLDECAESVYAYLSYCTRISRKALRCILPPIRAMADALPKINVGVGGEGESPQQFGFAYDVSYALPFTSRADYRVEVQNAKIAHTPDTDGERENVGLLADVVISLDLPEVEGTRSPYRLTDAKRLMLTEHTNLETLAEQVEEITTRRDGIVCTPRDSPWRFQVGELRSVLLPLHTVARVVYRRHAREAHAQQRGDV